MNRLETAQAAYVVAFGVMPPEPYGISENRLIDVIEQAVADGKPVDDGFDWFPDLPPDAVI